MWDGSEGGTWYRECADSRCSSASSATLGTQNGSEVKCPGPCVLQARASGLRAGGSFSGDRDRLPLGNAPPCDSVLA